MQRILMTTFAAFDRRVFELAVQMALRAGYGFVGFHQRKARGRPVEFLDRCIALHIENAGGLVATDALLVGEFFLVNVLVLMAAHAADRFGIEALELRRRIAEMTRPT